MSSEYKNKLYDFQAVPPATAWENISAALDEAENSLSGKLYNFQQQPLPEVWNRISKELDADVENKPGKVIQPFRFSKAVKYMAAASVLIFIAGAAYIISTDTTTNNQTITEKNSSLTKRQNPVQLNLEAINKDSLKKEPETLTAAPAPASKSKYALANAKAGFEKYIAKKRSSVTIPKQGIPVKNLAVVPAAKEIINTSKADRYMIVTNASGEVVRLPKKVYSAFACTDETFALENTPCKERLAKLQNKISHSMTTDFASFLDLLKNLQENR